MLITASKLYDYLKCPHRIWRDIYGPQKEKIIETNPFVQLLWDRGVSYEKKVMGSLGEYLDLSEGSIEERFEKTKKALQNNVPLIYQGVLIKDDLMGIPDLLEITSNGKYIPIDIKSGMGVEGAGDEEGGKLKDHYAVQLALYCDVLSNLGFKNDKQGIILDIKGNRVLYDLNLTIGKIKNITYWQLYENTRKTASLIISNKIKNNPALAGACKLCPWYNSCKKWVEETDDLTGIFYVGRSIRDTINQDIFVNKIDDILDLDLNDLLSKKKADKNFLKGIGEKTIEKTIYRANVLKILKKPVINGEIFLPDVSYELFFDIEDDPTREFIYLHGVYERSKKGERYINFTAKDTTPKAEKEAWSNFWEYIRSLPVNDFAVYYYSSHEKNTYKKMQKMYPEVVSEKELNDFFENPNVIDLYQDIIMKCTDWPVSSYSLKAIAQYLGFKWRDETPSGALSIQWFNEYIDKKDAKILDRILIYNEDDCKATMILKDEIKKLLK